ncbi:apolipoprotein O, a isoform X2 [Ctenopharyngodon idella]|uniref:apolipoprotein O, a isoform X2 n=1 Tax=Ctenopharyngodon idella TaxID=7959 RepID=UPI0022319ED9|nr:apolipoprotein O, a isoform X2 [Ctenopharyngodon idella]
MYKVGGVAGVTGTLGLISASVLAASATADDKPRTTLSVEELSLYTTPQQKIQYVEPEKGSVEEGVSTLRKLAEPYTTWCQGVYGTVKPKVDSTVQFGQNSYAYLKNPPPEFYPRAGIIGFAGILGLFLGRGSRLKRLIYPTGLMAVGASMYYPQEAVTIAKKTGDSIYDLALQAYVTVEKLIKDKPASKSQQKVSLSHIYNTVYIFTLVHAFPGNQTHDLCVSSTMLFELQIQQMLCLETHGALTSLCVLIGSSGNEFQRGDQSLGTSSRLRL